MWHTAINIYAVPVEIKKKSADKLKIINHGRIVYYEEKSWVDSIHWEYIIVHSVIVL